MPLPSTVWTSADGKALCYRGPQLWDCHAANTKNQTCCQHLIQSLEHKHSSSVKHIAKVTHAYMLPFPPEGIKLIWAPKTESLGCQCCWLAVYSRSVKSGCGVFVGGSPPLSLFRRCMPSNLPCCINTNESSPLLLLHWCVHVRYAFLHAFMGWSRQNYL